MEARSRSDYARPPSPCRDTAELASLLRLFYGVAPVPEASPWRGERVGDFGQSNGGLENENRREDGLRIPASSCRFSATPMAVCFEPGIEEYLFLEVYKSCYAWSSLWFMFRKFEILGAILPPRIHREWWRFRLC